MKISIIISDISKTGGTERAVVTLANILCKKYDKVTIVSLTKTLKQESYYEIDSRVVIKFLNNEPLPFGLFKKISWCVATVFLLRKNFKNNSADFIVSTGHNNNWLMPFVKSNKQTKVIACEHIVYSSIPRVSKFFMYITYRFLDRIVVLSEKAKQSFSEYSNVSVIANTIPFKTKVESELTTKQILIVGRLSAEKGLERLIPVGAFLKQKFPDWHITVVGDGEERNKLRKLIEEAGLTNVIKLEGLSTDVQSYYLNSSIYIMTSYFEAFPMVLLEAQSFGLPIVAFDCPEGPSQIVNNGENGFLIENGNTNDFVEKISVLIGNEILRKEFGRKAKTNTLKFSEEKIMKRWIELFREII